MRDSHLSHVFEHLPAEVKRSCECAGKQILLALHTAQCFGGELPSFPCGDERTDEENKSAHCEDFLSTSAINLLRGVTPPAACVEQTSSSQSADVDQAEYGRYGDEELTERRARVRARPTASLFCMSCRETYSLDPKVSNCDHRASMP